jgi:dihydrofolate synthase/folylpolyglutamate synthase
VGHGLSEYQKALDYLFVRTTGQWKFGLERTQALLAALGNPHERLACVHVGGTNGKGSVCATIERSLRDQNFRVAKYTSPHLVDFRERMLVDGVPVPEGAVVDFIHRWTPVIERIGATFFEATTAMALSLFAEADVDIVVLEVGLGGRLDATNVVMPLAAIVTNIGLDHTEYLGATREAIAAEKGGIFKRGRPAIIGEREQAIADLLGTFARDAGASSIDVAADTMSVDVVSLSARGTRFALNTRSESITCDAAMIGAHQAWNAAVAISALGSLPAPFTTSASQVCASLPRVRVAGRFQMTYDFIFEVAHNREGAAVCAATLAAVDPPRPRSALFSVLADKDWRGMLEELAPHIDTFVLTRAPTSPANRAWNPDEGLAEAARRGWTAIVESDFDAAIGRAREMGKTVLVTGSFHTVGDAMMRLHVSPLAG